jgi:hypothetical protein
MRRHRPLRRVAGSTLLAAAVGLAGCGGADAGGGGATEGCPLEDVPFLDNVCPSDPLQLPPLVQPEIRSFAVSPADVEAGQSVTVTAEFVGEGSVTMVSGSRAILWNTAITSGIARASPPLPPGPGPATVSLRAIGLTDGYAIAEVTATATVNLR